MVIVVVAIVVVEAIPTAFVPIVNKDCFEFEFAGAEGVPGFLDGGVALADGGIAGAADDQVDAGEAIEIFGLGVAGEGEVELGLFGSCTVAAEKRGWLVAANWRISAAAAAVSGVSARRFLKAVRR